jgi:uncharacterized membrane protein
VRRAGERRLTVAGLLLGVGLGGFVDGIVLHQILQWHDMLSSVHPPTTLGAMRLNMRADGWFHAATWLATALGVALLWRGAQARGAQRPDRWLVGTMLAGWGLFNLVEGLVDHQLLGLHHVHGTPDPLWDWGFVLLGGLGLLALGWALRRSTRSGAPPRVAA